MTNPSKPDFYQNFNKFNSASRGPTAVFGAGDGGGPVVEIWHEGVKEYNGFPFEQSFRGGVQVTVLPDGDVLVGAGKGGGPRWQRWTRTKLPWVAVITGLNAWGKISDQFLGGRVGSEMRTGCGFTPSGLPTYGYSETNIVLPVQPFLAQPWATLPGDTMRANAILSAVPVKLQERCVKEGVNLFVYGGSVITDMKEYRALKGLKTYMDGDGGRTWDQVAAAAFGDKCFVTESGSHTLHEFGHIVTEFMWRDSEVSNNFYDLWNDNKKNWETPYESTEMSEAAAEVIRRHIERPASNDHLRGVRGYLAKYLPEAI